MEGFQPKKIAIIGAGPMGLIFLKVFKSKGHNVVSFEKKSAVGGIWRLNNSETEQEQGYAELNTDGSSDSMYDSVLMNSSKFTSCSSYHLLLEKEMEEAGRVLTRKQFLEWVEGSAIKMNVIENIRFNHEVVRVDKLIDGWNVSYQAPAGKTGKEKFDFIVACPGNSYPQFPQNIKDMDKFKGISLHSSQVRYENKLFPNKTVLVVGANHSGLDMVHWALKNDATKVYVSLAKTSNLGKNWFVLERMHVKKPKIPVDLHHCRYNAYDRPDVFLDDFLKPNITPIYKTKPGDELTIPLDVFALGDSAFITEQKALEKLIIVDKVQSISQNGARFIDGSIVDDVDIIIYATGFKHWYPWLRHLYPDEEHVKNEHYYHMLPPDDNLHGIAMSCVIDGISNYLTGVELQARWLCKFWLTRNYDEDGRIYSVGELKHMKNAIEAYKAQRKPFLTFRYVHEYGVYYDSMALDIGCLPPDFRPLLAKGTPSDIEMGITMLMAPISMTMPYRVSGPDAFPEAPQFLINLTKYVIGEDTFQEMVREATEDLGAFYEKYGLKEKRLIPHKHHMQPFIEGQ